MSEITEKKTLKAKLIEIVSNINPLVVIFCLCVLLAGLTYLIPGGEYERHTVELLGSKREIVVPGSFHAVPSVPQGIMELWTVFMRGAVEGAERSFVIMLSAGALTAIIATGAINAGIATVISRFKNYGLVFIPILVYAVGFCGASFGMYEESIPFILVLSPLMLAMGFDSMIAVLILYWGIALGFACGITNPYNVGIGQAIANVPLYSGAGYRVFCWFVVMGITSIAIIKYARKIKKNPEQSLSFEEDKDNRKRLLEANPEEHEANIKMTKQRAAALIILFIGFGTLMYGIMEFSWGFKEIGSLFLWMGIIIPLVGGLSVSEMINKNIEGMQSVIIAIVMMSAAQIIYFILHDSKILDTILNFTAGYLDGISPIIIAYIMYFVSAITVGLISSSSGTAATIMPILAPLADVLHFPKQIVVLAFQFATATFNFWMPWDGISFTICSMAGVNFFKYIRKSAVFAFCWYIPTVLVLLAIAVIMGYQ